MILNAASEYRVVVLYLFWITTIFQTSVHFKTNKCHHGGPLGLEVPGQFPPPPLIWPWPYPLPKISILLCNLCDLSKRLLKKLILLIQLLGSGTETAQSTWVGYICFICSQSTPLKIVFSVCCAVLRPLGRHGLACAMHPKRNMC